MQYKTLNHLWHDTLKIIMNSGEELDSRAGKTKEILGFQVELTNPLNNILLGFPERKFSLSYACAEMLWYLSGTGNIDMIEAYAPSYSKFAEDGIAYGAYGYRWRTNPGFEKENNRFLPESNRRVHWTGGQLGAVIHLLKDKPNTRQAIITCWDAGDLIHAILGDHKDLPCTISLKFFVRNNKLHLIADMRSNDAWLGLPYDIFCFTTLQRLVAAECKLQLGTYIHQAGSEHLYECNFEKVDKILKDYWPECSTADHWIEDNHKFNWQHNIRYVLDLEKYIRESKFSSTYNMGWILEAGRFPMDNIFQDLIVGCATKWIDVHPSHFYNPLFQEWQKQNLEG